MDPFQSQHHRPLTQIGQPSHERLLSSPGEDGASGGQWIESEEAQVEKGIEDGADAAGSEKRLMVLCLGHSLFAPLSIHPFALGTGWLTLAHAFESGPHNAWRA
jgi:hypothetical protein